MRTFKTEITNLTDRELNSFFLIKHTDYNRNVKYGTLTKQLWKKLYTSGSKFWTISRIAETYGASYKTVKVAVDDTYAAKLNAARVAYNKKYYDSHTICRRPKYDRDLANHKRSIIFANNVAHLKAI